MGRCNDYLSCYHHEDSIHDAPECWYLIEEVCEHSDSPFCGQPCPWEGMPEQAKELSEKLRREKGERAN
jgi:Fe-S-cluster-containing dehydrogenase component